MEVDSPLCHGFLVVGAGKCLNVVLFVPKVDEVQCWIDVQGARVDRHASVVIASSMSTLIPSVGNSMLDRRAMSIVL